MPIQCLNQKYKENKPCGWVLTNLAEICEYYQRGGEVFGEGGGNGVGYWKGKVGES